MSTVRPTRRIPATLRRRRIIAWVSTSVVLLVATLGTLTLGDAGADPASALAALVGFGDDGLIHIVREWRLPRALLALMLGALLGWAGALFQIITRNPLGSPDILGFSAGSFLGVLLAMTAGATTVFAITGSAVAGGLVTAALVFGLSLRTGTRGFALVVTGIGVSAMLGAVNLLLIVRSNEQVAHAAAIWALGSLNGVGAQWVVPTTVALVLVAAAIAAMAPALAVLELGEDRSRTLGVRAGRTRIAAMVVGTLALAATIAVAGPIAFISLAAPQIARRLWRSGTIPLGATAVTGAALLAVSDLLSSRLFAPTILPTGMVTVCVGGVYLAWMLTSRKAGSTS